MQTMVNGVEGCMNNIVLTMILLCMFNRLIPLLTITVQGWHKYMEMANEWNERTNERMMYKADPNLQSLTLYSRFLYKYKLWYVSLLVVLSSPVSSPTMRLHWASPEVHQWLESIIAQLMLCNIWNKPLILGAILKI